MAQPLPTGRKPSVHDRVWSKANIQSAVNTETTEMSTETLGAASPTSAQKSDPTTNK